MKTITFVLSILLFLSSCSCGIPLKVSPIQRDDKKLACKDIILEINEAEHYKSEAQKSKDISVGEYFAPVCWINGYIDGEQAMKAANARIDYLGNIYDLLDCGGVAKQQAAESSKKQSDKKESDPSQAPGPQPYMTPGQQDSYMRYLHEHVDKDGNIYKHSHPYKAPHRHLGDIENGGNPAVDSSSEDSKK